MLFNLKNLISGIFKKDLRTYILDNKQNKRKGQIAWIGKAAVWSKMDPGMFAAVV